jgi:hypothetical protein
MPSRVEENTSKTMFSPQPAWGTFSAHVVRKVSGGWKAIERTISTKMKALAATKRTTESTRAAPKKLPGRCQAILSLCRRKSSTPIKGIRPAVTMPLACQSLASTRVGNSEFQATRCKPPKTARLTATLQRWRLLSCIAVVPRLRSLSDL